MIRVFIVDDHAIVRAGLRRLLTESNDIEVVGEVGSAEEALAVLGGLAADVVLLDLALPGMSGLEALPLFRRMRPDLRVLALSMYSEEQYALRVFQAGADGFISKGSVVEELLVALRRVAAGRKYVSNAAAERMAENLQQPPAASAVDAAVAARAGDPAPDRQGRAGPRDRRPHGREHQDRGHLPLPAARQAEAQEQRRDRPLRRGARPDLGGCGPHRRR